MKKKLKVGDLVYLKNVGFPFGDWNGLSATVVETNAGGNGMYVRVQPIIAMPNEFGGTMTEALFHPEKVHHEDRPWLKRYLKQILKLKAKLKEVAEFAETLD